MAGPAAPPGADLPLLLLLGFRVLIDDVHAELVAADPGIGPLHGVVLDAIGEGTTATALGRRLGVSKQAAAKTVAALERDGYVERAADPADARAKIVRVTPRGRRASDAMARHRQLWAARLGPELVDAMEEALRTMAAEGRDRSVK